MPTQNDNVIPVMRPPSAPLMEKAKVEMRLNKAIGCKKNDSASRAQTSKPYYEALDAES